MELKGAWMTRMKRPGKKARTKIRRNRKVVVGDEVGPPGFGWEGKSLLEPGHFCCYWYYSGGGTLARATGAGGGVGGALWG